MVNVILSAETKLMGDKVDNTNPKHFSVQSYATTGHSLIFLCHFSSFFCWTLHTGRVAVDLFFFFYLFVHGSQLQAYCHIFGHVRFEVELMSLKLTIKNNTETMNDWMCLPLFCTRVNIAMLLLRRETTIRALHTITPSVGSHKPSFFWLSMVCTGKESLS